MGRRYAGLKRRQNQNYQRASSRCGLDRLSTNSSANRRRYSKACNSQYVTRDRWKRNQYNTVYEDDDYFDSSDTISHRFTSFIASMAKEKQEKKNTVVCNNVTFYPAKVAGTYLDVKTGEVIKIADS